MAALKYHPDRNPGHESEFNAKFQAIQSAHDVLLDPQQRARYDADRIKATAYHTFGPPPRPPRPPPRAPQTNAPPPPPRQPPPFTRTQFPPPPPPAGSRRSYAPPKPEPRNSWAQASAEDARMKTENSEAWEQMRHRHGPPPSTRPAPRYSAKSAAFAPGYDSGSSGKPTDSIPKRPGRDPLDDAYSHVPGVSRSHTTRTPKKAGFAPGTPGGDEPPARNSSAYFNVFRAERAAASREYAHPPPSSRHPPPSKRADPLQACADRGPPKETFETFPNAARVSTPYATSGGEKTYFSSQPLGRSASWKEGTDRSNFYESEPTAAPSPHLRPPSGTPDRDRTPSSRTRSRSEHRLPSPISSTSSSSDESIKVTSSERFYRATRPPHDGQRAPGRGGTDGRGKPSLKPTSEVDDAEDEDSARSGRSVLGSRWKDGSRNRPPDRHQPPQAGEDHPAGFMHRPMNHVGSTDRPDVPSSNASKIYTPTNPTVPPRPLNKPRSWQNYDKVAHSVQQDGYADPTDPNRQDGKARMYEPSSSPPSSTKWSDQWPFKSPKKPRHPAAALPPLWAIPSSLFPKQPKVEAPNEIKDATRLEKESPLPPKSNNADRDEMRSFTFPPPEPSKAPPHPPSLRSRSSESINVKFTPDWPRTFTGGTNEYFFSSSAMQNGDAEKKRSPTTDDGPLPPPSTKAEHVGNDSETAEKKTEMNAPPKDPGLPATATEEWAQHFRPAAWAYPPPVSPSHKTIRKRLPTSKKSWKPSSSPFAPAKPRKAFPSVVDADKEEEEGEEPDASSVAESTSSKISGDESPMDIDPVLTPPSGPPHLQVNGETRSPAFSAPTETTPRPPTTAPSVPPRHDESAPVEDSHLNLGGLKNVAPLAPTAAGLRNLTDLNNTLPFESRPSTLPPVPETSTAALVLPNPPKAPLAPESLTQTTWERYEAHMGVYMFEWNAFNGKMLDHFNTRQASVPHVLKSHWMSARGVSHQGSSGSDGGGGWGYEKYMGDLEEDFRVRQHWDVSWEKHRTCLLGLGHVRDRLRAAGGKVKV